MDPSSNLFPPGGACNTLLIQVEQVIIAIVTAIHLFLKKKQNHTGL